MNFHFLILIILNFMFKTLFQFLNINPQKIEIFLFFFSKINLIIPYLFHLIILLFISIYLSNINL